MFVEIDTHSQHFEKGFQYKDHSEENVDFLLANGPLRLIFRIQSVFIVGGCQNKRIHHDTCQDKVVEEAPVHEPYSHISDDIRVTQA